MGERRTKSLHLLYVVIGTAVAVAIGQYLGREAGESAAQRGNAKSLPVVSLNNQAAPVVALVTIQDPEGTSEADLDIGSLKALEQWAVQTTVRKTRSKYVEQGLDPGTFDSSDVESSSQYVLVNDKKLAIIRLRSNQTVRAVMVIGHHLGQVVRVSCVRSSDHDIPIWSGECGDTIKKSLGVSIETTTNASAPNQGAPIAPTNPWSVASEAPADPMPASALPNASRKSSRAPPVSSGSIVAADLETQLDRAARGGNLSTVHSLLAKGASANARNSFGYSALSGAAGAGHTAIVRLLLDKGADPNQRLPGGTSPLDEAAMRGYVDIVRLLLERGADPNVVKDNGWTPLISAAALDEMEILTLLVQHGADVNARLPNGGTVLHFAAKGERATDTINLLLKYGANPNARDNRGRTYRDLLPAQ